MGILEQNPQQGVIVPKIAPISGRYYGPRTLLGGVNTTLVASSANLYAAPLWFPMSFVVDRIGINVTVAGAGASTMRIGLYDALPVTDLPGALLVDSGVLAGDTAAPFIAEATISLQILAGKLYWVALSVSANLTVTATTSNLGLLGAATPAEATRAGVTRVFTHGALPASWGTPASYVASLPEVAFRAV